MFTILSSTMPLLKCTLILSYITRNANLLDILLRFLLGFLKHIFRHTCFQACDVIFNVLVTRT